MIQLAQRRRHWGQVLDVRPRNSGSFYRGDAARLASAAARPARTGGTAPPPSDVLGIELDEPDRPPLTPQPATNQNAGRRPAPRRRRTNAVRILAWVVLSPWYVAVALASAGLDALMLQHLLRLY